jgi:hypothetical protein
LNPNDAAEMQQLARGIGKLLDGLGGPAEVLDYEVQLSETHAKRHADRPRTKAVWEREAGARKGAGACLEPAPSVRTSIVGP